MGEKSLAFTRCFKVRCGSIELFLTIILSHAHIYTTFMYSTTPRCSTTSLLYYISSFLIAMALHCCECGVKLAKSTAKFCPKGHKGHPQFDTPKT
jgi:hypothetical protein